MSKNYTVLNNESYYMNEDKTILVEVIRLNNDFNGNPRYKIRPVNFTKIEKLSNVSRNMYKDGYYIIQSYNIVQDLSRMFSEMEQLDYFKDFAVFEDGYLVDYREVKAFY